MIAVRVFVPFLYTINNQPRNAGLNIYIDLISDDLFLRTLNCLNQGSLGRGRASIYAQIGSPAIRAQVARRDLPLVMIADELFVVFIRSKQRRQKTDRVNRISAQRQT